MFQRSSKPNQKRSAFPILLGLFVLGQLAACAKKLPEKLPDDFERDYHSIEALKAGATITTEGNGIQALSAASSVPEEREVLALNELELYPIKVSSSEPVVNKLFDNFQLEATGPDQSFKVQFKLTQERLIAYVKNTGSLPASTANQALYQGQDIAIFHYPVEEYGILEHKKNDLDENTREVEFKKTSMDRATHVRFMSSPEKRVDSGLRSFYKQNIFLKQKLNKVTWNFENLANFFKLKGLSSAASANGKQLVRTVVLDNTLYILQPVANSKLNNVQKLALKKQDPRYLGCESEAVLNQVGVSKKEECTFVPVYFTSITPLQLKLEKDNQGVTIDTVELDNNVDAKKAPFLTLNEHSVLQNFISEEVSENYKAQNIFFNDALNEQKWSVDQAKEKFNLDAKQVVFTQVIGKNLWFLAPSKKSELSMIERSMIPSQKDRNNSLFGQCSQEQADAVALSLDQCILLPVAYQTVAPLQVAYHYQSEFELPKLQISEARDYRDAHFFYLGDNRKPARFDIKNSVKLTDKVITNRFQDFDTSAEYLYVPMTMGTPREVVQADPFYQGQEKIVKLKFAKNGLEVYEMEKDGRFIDNPLNQKPVMVIPGAYKQYQCVKDEFDFCTERVEENQDLSWEQKAVFIPELSDMKLQEMNSLDISTVEADSCLQRLGVETVDHTIEPGVINIELEKTYKTDKSWECIRDNYLADTEQFDGFSNAGFKVRFFYSLVKLDKLASKDYETVAYPIPEHSDFGFFKSKTESLNDIFDPSRKNKSYFLNRWNPKQKVVTYHLSDSFNRPENADFKKATYKSVEGINRSLKTANAGFEIKLQEPSGKKSGDLRYNMVVLIDDPLSNGLLGYGPTVTNPRTGEIVQGHINMYGGVLRSMTRRVWEGMVDLTEQQLEEAMASSTPPGAQHDDHSVVAHADHGLDTNSLSNRLQAPFMAQKVKMLESLGEHDHMLAVEERSEHALQSLDNRFSSYRSSKAPNARVANDAKALENLLAKEEERIHRYSINCAYSEEFFNIGGTFKTLIPGIQTIPGVMTAKKTLKRWDKLTKTQQRVATNMILPYVYTSTFVHEFGHNLGLRHNFAGSFDQENFYSQAEAQALGLKAAPAYSSIMDYAHSELNELTLFGKYDIAALRFGYARQVENASSTVVNLGKASLTEFKAANKDVALKEFQFCTDENAGLSASCNRFDEGTSLVEIAKHYIENYKRSYRYRNFRDGRSVFKARDLVPYVVRRSQEFNLIRDLFEEHEFFASIFGPEVMVQGCSPEQEKTIPICKMIRDRIESVKLSADFFLEVIKTPDHTCAVVAKSAPNKLHSMKKLTAIYEDIKFKVDHVPTSCFDPAVVTFLSENKDAQNKELPLVPIAEAGKFLNEFKDNDPNFKYADDRYALGIWTDKLLAIKALMQRYSGRPTSEFGLGALFDLPYVQPKVIELLAHITLGEPLEELLPFKTVDGQLLEIPYSLDQDYVIEGPDDDLLGIKLFFGLPRSGQSLLIDKMLAMAKSWSLTNDLALRSTALKASNFFSIKKRDVVMGMNPQVMQITLGDYVYGADESNTLAFNMMLSMNNYPFLKKIGKAKVEEVLKLRVSPPLPDSLNEQEKIAISLPNDLIDSLIQVAQQGVPVTEAQLISVLQEELGKKAFIALQLGADHLIKLLELKDTLDDAPADATEEVKRLYGLPIYLLDQFSKDQLEPRLKRYEVIIPLLPQHTRADELVAE